MYANVHVNWERNAKVRVTILQSQIRGSYVCSMARMKIMSRIYTPHCKCINKETYFFHNTLSDFKIATVLLFVSCFLKDMFYKSFTIIVYLRS